MTGREPHPIFPLLEPEVEASLPGEQVEKYYALRAEAMTLEKDDPFRYGYVPPVWNLVDKELAKLGEEFPVGVRQALILGGNRASKTHYAAAKRVIKLMVEKEGARVWCLQATESASRADQQQLVFRMIPREWRPESGKLRHGRTTKINFSTASGFTENTFVLPNGSQCWFKFYGADVGTIEGAELDLAWADEIVPPDWMEALRFRLVTRNGLLLVTFTPVKGYSPTVKEFLDGATTTEEEEAELLPRLGANLEVLGHEKVPRVQRCLTKTARVFYFHTSDNPYGNYAAMKVELDGSPRERVLTRAYGVPTRASLTQFPLFRDTIHVVSLNFFAEVEKAGVARYFLVDPCPGNRQSGRNWFMVWLAIDALGRKFYYREWPSYGHPGAYIPGHGDLGAWAVPGKAADGERGPAQTSLGFSLSRYKEEILRLEGGEKIYERWMDSRYANAPTMAKEETSTLLDTMQRDLEMDFLAAPGSSIAEGVELINTALYYDVNQPINPTNMPKMYVTEACPNLIYSLKEWTGQDGLHGACKDPIDLVRYAEGARLAYVSEEMFAPLTPWLNQFQPGRRAA